MRAQLRLARDLRFLRTHPIDGVAAAPLEENFFIWHANFELQRDVVIHFEIHFPQDYPLRPPQVLFATGFPHLNCFAKSAPDGRAMYHLCLNMLGNETDQPPADEPGSGWSSAYDAHGLLTQIQAFLLDGRVARQRHNGLDIQEAIRRAQRYSCPHCPHTPQSVSPPLELAHQGAGNCLSSVAVRRPMLCGIAGVRIAARGEKTLTALVPNDEWRSAGNHTSDHIECEIDSKPLWFAFQSFIVRAACSRLLGCGLGASCAKAPASLPVCEEWHAAVVIQKHARACSVRRLVHAMQLLNSTRQMRFAHAEVALNCTQAESKLSADLAILETRSENIALEINACNDKMQRIVVDIAAGANAMVDRERKQVHTQLKLAEKQEANAATKTAEVVTKYAAIMFSLQCQASQEDVNDKARKLRATEKSLRQVEKLLAMQQQGEKLLPEHLCKIARHDSIQAACQDAHGEHRLALEAHDAMLARRWENVYQQIFQVETDVIKCEISHSKNLSTCKDQLAISLEDIRAAHRQQDQAFQTKLLECDCNRKALSCEQIAVAEQCCAEDSIASLPDVEEAVSGILDDAVEQYRTLKVRCGREKELQSRKAARKKLSASQKSALRLHEEHAAELGRLETRANMSAVQGAARTCIEQVCACTAKAYEESVSSLQNMHADELCVFMSEEDAKKSRTLTKLLRQIQEIWRKSAKARSPEQRSKLERQKETQTLLEGLQGEAMARKAERLIEAEHMCQQLKLQSDVAHSRAYADSVQAWIASQPHIRAALHTKMAARQHSVRTLVKLVSARALCSSSMAALNEQRQTCDDQAEAARRNAEQQVLKQEVEMSAKHIANKHALLERQADLNGDFHSFADSDTIAAFEKLRTQFLEQARKGAESRANAEHDLESHRTKLASLSAPGAQARQDQRLLLIAQEHSKLEQRVASLSQALAVNSQEKAVLIASFKRVHGREARSAALIAWSQFRCASVRASRSPTLPIAWKAWNLGTSVACKRCGALVPRPNITLHEAHCEKAYRFAPKSGETYFPKVPYQVMVHSLLRFLTHSELLVLSAAGNRKIASIAEDGFLWKQELHRLYPKSALSAQNMTDWKYVFMCEMNQVVAALQCFHTKAAFNDDGVVLGVPISFTVNPKKQQTDYIRSTMDLLSYDAFKLDKVRRTVWREEFTNWLPMYICEDHWQRGLPLLKRHVLPLVPHWRSTKFEPEMCMEVFCKAVNTLVVLLCDKGEHFSESVAKGFCMWHRWILRCIQEWPQIQKSVEKRICDFCRGESFRSKEREPSMGDFIALLLVSDRFTWDNVVGHILSEWMDRQVLWNCTEHPILDQIAAKDTLNDTQRIELSWSAKPVGRRLYAFHAVFLDIFKRNMSCRDIAAEYDMFYGQPAPSCLKRISKAFSAVMSMEGWPHLFKILRVQCPSKAKLAQLLRNAVDSSARRKYHRRGMDFQKIHQSGISKILKKGESYRAAADLKVVELQDFWAWHGDTKFLDATCLVYDSNHHELGLLDFRHTTCDFLGGGHSGVIHHSGDVMDHSKQSGTHSIVVQLDQLPPHVHYLYFVLSAWAGAVLSEILQPNVRLVDEQSGGAELCRYNVESTSDAGRRTSILMCVLHRRVERSSQSCIRWELKAIGEVGNGAADNYTPIQKMIQDYASKTNWS